MKYTSASSITTSVAHSVYNEGRSGKRGLFLEFVDHVKIKNLNIALPTRFLDESLAKEIHKDTGQESP